MDTRQLPGQHLSSPSDGVGDAAGGEFAAASVRSSPRSNPLLDILPVFTAYMLAVGVDTAGFVEFKDECYEKLCM